jgi:hypothetical protein
MSAMPIQAVVKGGWPLVIDFEQRSPGRVNLQVSAEGADIITYRLDSYGLGRHLVQFQLPQEVLGNELRPALIGITAATDAQSRDTLRDFRLYGLGAGPRAVGSVAIEKVGFEPPRVNPASGQTAKYRFFSKSDFKRVSAEFMRVFDRADGSQLIYVTEQPITQGVRSEQWVGMPQPLAWNGRDQQNQLSGGFHLLQVRVWDDQRGDWVAAWSETKVLILEQPDKST